MGTDVAPSNTGAFLGAVAHDAAADIVGPIVAAHAVAEIAVRSPGAHNASETASPRAEAHDASGIVTPPPQSDSEAIGVPAHVSSSICSPTEVWPKMAIWPVSLKGKGDSYVACEGTPHVHGFHRPVCQVDRHVGLIPICPAKPRKLGLMIGQASPAAPESLPADYMPFDGAPAKRLAKLGGYACTSQLWSEFDRIDLVACAPVRKFRLPHHGVENGYRKHNWDGHVFPHRKAMKAARQLVHSGRLMCDYVLVVLCGKKVARAFDLDLSREQPYAQESNGILFLVMPHTSGVSHLWNDDVFWPRAAGFFRAYLNAARTICPGGSLRYKNDKRRRITNKRAAYDWEHWLKRREVLPSDAGVPLARKKQAIITQRPGGPRTYVVPQAKTQSEESKLLTEEPVEVLGQSVEIQPGLGLRLVTRSRFFAS